MFLALSTGRVYTWELHTNLWAWSPLGHRCDCKKFSVQGSLLLQAWDNSMLVPAACRHFCCQRLPGSVRHWQVPFHQERHPGLRPAPADDHEEGSSAGPCGLQSCWVTSIKSKGTFSLFSKNLTEEAMLWAQLLYCCCFYVTFVSGTTVNNKWGLIFSKLEVK